MPIWDTMPEKRTKKQRLEWNVIEYNINSRSLDVYNVFWHFGFLNDTKKNAKKNKDNKEEFLSNLKRDAMYYFWSKCEWEIVVSSWPTGDAEEKIDVYDQLAFNWDKFSEYVWENAPLLRSKKSDVIQYDG